jgi:hypothetical protein
MGAAGQHAQDVAPDRVGESLGDCVHGAIGNGLVTRCQSGIAIGPCIEALLLEPRRAWIAPPTRGRIQLVCGRITLTRKRLEDIAAELDAYFDADDAARYRARYNIAPTDLHWLLVARGSSERPRVVPAVWGLPSSRQKPVINVQAETLRRGAFRSRRHAVAIADGFYEWTGAEKSVAYGSRRMTIRSIVRLVADSALSRRHSAA